MSHIGLQVAFVEKLLCHSRGPGCIATTPGHQPSSLIWTDFIPTTFKRLQIPDYQTSHQAISNSHADRLVVNLGSNRIAQHLYVVTTILQIAVKHNSAKLCLNRS